MNKISLLLIIGLLVMASCDRTRTSTGWDYAPDMYYSNAAESYTPNENFEDGMTMRMPVEGTVPRGTIPFSYEKTDEDRLLAGKELVSPLETNASNIARGKEVFEIFCVTCHGKNADGEGFLYTSGRYPYPPASLLDENVKALPDGEIYHVMTVGYGVMGAHGSMIRQEDRWKIIQYIREELHQ